jgi:alpha-galactosidase
MSTKIVVIGAASTVFGPKLLRDLVHYKDLAGSELCLVDVNTEHLGTYTRLARRVSDEGGMGYTIVPTTDRREVLPGAEYVIETFAVGRNEIWRQDFAIPVAHGVRHVNAECGGPGALMLTCRNTPELLAVAHDVEELCPEAWLLVTTNPEGRLMTVLDRHASVKCVGLCHGIEIILNKLDKDVLGIPATNLEPTAAGTNHFTWLQDLRRADTGESVLADLLEKLAAKEPDYMPLTRKMLDVFGLLPSPGDLHIGEFLQFAWEYLGTDGPDFAGRMSKPPKIWAHMARQASGQKPIDEYLRGRTWADTLAGPFIDALANNHRTRMPALNVRNDGCVPNLPDDAIVEVPAMVDSQGVHPLRVDPLPDGIAAMCAREIGISRLVAAAAANGDRNAALQALLVDPHLQSVETAEKILDELIAAQADYLPQFRR